MNRSQSKGKWNFADLRVEKVKGKPQINANGRNPPLWTESP